MLRNQFKFLLSVALLFFAFTNQARSEQLSNNNWQYWQDRLRQVDESIKTEAWVRNQKSQKARAFSYSSYEFEIRSQQTEPILFQSKDGERVLISVRADSLSSESILVMQKLLSEIQYGIPISRDNLTYWAWMENAGDLRSGALLSGAVVQYLDSILAAEANSKTILNKEVLLNLRTSFQNRFNRQLQAYNAFRSEELLKWQREWPEAKQRDWQEQLWKALVKSDRKTIVALFDQVLPRKLMSPMDQEFWRHFLSTLKSEPSAQRFKYYRGTTTDFHEYGPTGTRSENSELQLSWPLRNLMAGQVSLQGLLFPSVMTIDQCTKEGKDQEGLLSSIYTRRRFHSGGGNTSKTIASPFLSTTTLSIGAKKFSRGEDNQSSGVISVNYLSAERVIKAKSQYVSENEALVFLFILPSERLAKVKSAPLPQQTDESIAKELAKAQKEGRLDADYEQRKYDVHTGIDLKEIYQSSGPVCTSAFR